MEHEIKALADQGDPAAIKVMHIVKICKVSVALNVFMIVLAFIFSGEIDLFMKKLF